MNKKSSVADSLYSEALSPEDGRPVSEMKVDLHIYVVPPELWREHLQSAVNQVINDTVSAGFIRVMPEATVQSLREEIETQVGFDLIPREFVFLKCVGRCFTRIKSKQERLLKVKNFIPPQAYAPEMFILELTPDIRAMPYSGSTSVQSQTSPPQSGIYSVEGKISGRIPPIKSNTVGVQTEDDCFLDEALNSFDDWERYEELGSDSQDDWLPSELLNNQDPNSKSTQTPFIGNVDRDVQKKPFQNHPAGGRSRNKDTGQTKGYDPPLSATPTHSPEVPVNLTRAVSIQTLSEKEVRELEELMRKQREEEKRKAEEAERLEKERLKQEAMEKRRQEEEQKRKREEQKRLQEQEEAEKRRQIEEQKRLEEERQRKLEEKRLEEEKRKEKEKIEKRKKEEAEKKKKEDEERRKREEEEKRRKREEEEERKKVEEEEERRKREEEEEEERRREEEELRKELERKQKEEKRRKEEEQKRKEQQRKIEEEKQKKKMLEQQKANEKVNLMKEIEELKAARLAMTQKRDELVKRTKQLQSSGKAPVIKHNARDNWKKKYFEEKKKTAPLDEHCNRLKRHLESIHQRILANMESVVPPPVNGQQNKLQKEAKGGSLQFRAKQMEHDVEEIQQRLEAVKMKLTGEMKLRNQAEKDTRLLRAELAQRKLHRNLPDGYRLTARSQAPTASRS